MFKNASRALAIAVTVLSAAVANSQTPDADWSGFYIGGMRGSTSADEFMHYEQNGSVTSIYDMYQGRPSGIFAGYNHQTGQWLIGGELGLTEYNTGYLLSGTDYALDRGVELRLRGGYVIGRALTYGFVGLSTSHWEADYSYDVSGLNYGGGVEVLVTDTVFVGFEYISREMSGMGTGGYSGHAAFDATQIRVGMRF